MPRRPKWPATDLSLRDGSSVRVRQLQLADEQALLAFMRALSRESLAMRFFGALSDDALRRMAGEVARSDDNGSSFDLIALHGNRIVGMASYLPLGEGGAEVAFLVADNFQGRGLGSGLLGLLAQSACSRGIQLFTASILPQNHRMLRVFEESGFHVQTDVGPGTIDVSFPTDIDEAARSRFEQRDWTAAVQAVTTFLKPRSIAVIGASRARGTIGGEVLHNLLGSGFPGPVYPVNSQADVVQSVVSYRDIEQVPGEVDLAVIVVPFDGVIAVAEACARKGVRALVVISAGFAETGEEGTMRQGELLRVCRTHGMRLVGPNCMGIVNTHPDARLNATFAPTPPPFGKVGFMSQSGALGLAVMDYAASLGLGLSSFVSVGNKADISGNDLLRYWDQDSATDVILLYLESFGNPRRFSSIARAVARRKPIVAVKSGRSPAGARASGSHTGALIAASDVTVDALFRQTGVIRTDTLSEMFDVATLLANQPVPKGRRVAILTNAGGPGILCADRCVAEGLEVPLLAERTRAELRELLAREASVSNPIDMIASAGADQYGEAIRILGRDPGIDAIIVIFIPPLVTRPEDVARAVVDAAQALGGTRTILSVFMQAQGVPEELRAPDVRIPSYAFPEEAAIALARAASYGEWLARPVVEPPEYPEIRREEAAAIIATALGRGADWLGPLEVAALLSCYGLPVLEYRSVGTPEEAAAAAAEFGGPVALKGVAPGLVHKTEAGAVRLGVARDAVLDAAREMEARLSGSMPLSAFLVQKMAHPGVEMIVGVVHDEHFGPVVACGAGGVLVELVKDVSVRLAPLSRREAEEMVDELRTRPLLSGYRGSPPRDVPALVDAILRISALVEDFPQIRDLDLNPILVHEKGASIVDARIRVAPAAPRPLPALRS